MRRCDPQSFHLPSPDNRTPHFSVSSTSFSFLFLGYPTLATGVLPFRPLTIISHEGNCFPQCLLSPCPPHGPSFHVTEPLVLGIHPSFTWPHSPVCISLHWVVHQCKRPSRGGMVFSHYLEMTHGHAGLREAHSQCLLNE